MSNTVSATIQSVTSGRLQSSGAFNTTFSGSPTLTWTRQFTSSEITKCYFNTYTVTSTPTSIDLTALADAYGAALSFATVKHLHVANEDITNNLTVGGGTNGLFAALPFTLIGYAASNSSSNGGDLNLTTNITVDGTHKILTLTASAGSVTVDVFLLGS